MAKGARFPLLLRLLVLCALAVSALPLRAEPVTVFAAASLKTALDEIATNFEQSTDHAVTLSYAGTPVLARQISLGAPADVFISASAEWMDWLADRQAIAPDTRSEIARNRLVLIAHEETSSEIALTSQDLAAAIGQNRIAMALVEAVPAGIYGKAALSHFGLWDPLSAQVAQTDNVRAALALVASGAALFGIVYASDARAEPRVSLRAVFPPESHPAIVYPAALVADRTTPAARAFLDHLSSDAAQRLFDAHGFLPAQATP